MPPPSTPSILIVILIPVLIDQFPNGINTFFPFPTDFMTSGIAVLLEEYALDHDPTRFALICTLPVIYCVSIVRSPFPFLLLFVS